MLISIVIPLYKCAPFIKELCKRLQLELEKISSNYEIILINDSSPFNDWENVIEASKNDSRIKGINLSRNFGQHYAITAGLDIAKGEWVVVMDGDLQDQPEEIAKLFKKAIEGFDIVLAKRTIRQDNYFKRKGSHYFYKALAYLTNTEQNAEVANFGIYNRKVIDAIISMGDNTRYFPTMVRWVGFNRTAIEVKHASREEGKSSYSFNSLIRLALNVILSFSDKPLRLMVKLGLFVSVISFAFAIFNFIKSLTGQIDVLGYSSLIISIWLLSGILITLIGMLGLYIGRIFEQVKNRPTYIIDQTINIK